MVNVVVLNYISNLIKTTWFALLISPFRQIAIICDKKSNVKLLDSVQLLNCWTVFNCETVLNSNVKTVKLY